jgi:hypothetical protein
MACPWKKGAGVLAADLWTNFVRPQPSRSLAVDEPVVSRPLFLPTPRQSIFLAVLALASLGHALYVRYFAIEQTSVSLACQAGAETWLCASMRLLLALHIPPSLGIAALIAAVLNLARPSVVLLGFALVAAGHGLVIYNTSLSALAVALLLLSFARPAPEPE